MDPHNTDQIFDPEIARAWLPVDIYVGGQEHAVLHLLYARFWHKVLYELDIIPNSPFSNPSTSIATSTTVSNESIQKLSLSEPFTKLIHQGMILGPDGEKMSKSRGNVISPDVIIQQHGANSESSEGRTHLKSKRKWPQSNNADDKAGSRKGTYAVLRYIL